jgi:hypothetical protein
MWWLLFQMPVSFVLKMKVLHSLHMLGATHHSVTFQRTEIIMFENTTVIQIYGCCAMLLSNRVPNISKDHSAFIFWIMQSTESDWSAWPWRWSCYSPLKLQELSAEHHVSEDLNHHVISPIIRICVICSDVINTWRVFNVVC